MQNLLSSFLYYLIIIPISKLPYRLLYILSDILFFLIYNVFRYRKKVVLNNLMNSFPHLTKKEIINISNKFYKHFSDLILEIIKGFTISSEQLKKRLLVINPEICNTYFSSNQNVFFVGGHFNNWEITSQAFSKYIKHNCIGIYKPLKNKFLNSKIFESRSKHGTKLVTISSVKKSIIENKFSHVVMFASDQNPSSTKNAIWVNFLNQETAVQYGVEKYAIEFNCPVIYVSVDKVKRGYYEVSLHLITDKPRSLKEGQITKEFTKLLENDICRNPQYWLWTHKRWKHKRKK